MTAFSKTPSTFAWIVVQLVYPLLPVALEGGIRYVVKGNILEYDTVNAATLAMSVGLLAIFVNQSLKGQPLALPDRTESDSRLGAATLFLVLAILFFVLFGVLVLLDALIHARTISGLDPALQAFQSVTFVSAVIPIVAAVVTQRSFKLRSSF